MIIQCPTCLTKFKLDDSKVSDEGTRVRCTKCKEVFVAKKEIPIPVPPPPPVQPKAPTVNDDLDFSFSTTFGDEREEEENREATPFQFGGGLEEELAKGNNGAKESEPSTVPPTDQDYTKEELAEETPFSFGSHPDEGPRKEEFAEETPFSFEAPIAEEPKATEKDDRGFDWGGMSYGEVNLPETQEEADEPPLGFDFTKREETAFGNFEFKDEENQEPSPGTSFAAPEEPVFTPPPVEKKVTFKEEAPPPPQPQVAAPTEGLAGGIEDEFYDEFAEESEPKKKYLFLKNKSVMAVLVLVVLSVSGFFIWKSYISSGKGVINLENISGYYAQNAEAGNIFVISGRAVNNTSQARSFFQVRGVLFNKKGEKLVQKEVYCGNIFSSKELISLSRLKIEADLVNKVGGSLANINLSPGKSVPFMIVFFDLPPDMTEFSVSNKSSQLASE